MHYFIFSVVFLALFSTLAGAKPNVGHGVILMYHHVSTDTPPSTSISPGNFAEHMAYLAKNHTVISLQRLMQSVSAEATAKQKLPDNAVVITFDDGYDNIALNAHPIIKQYGFPYTIFINPDLIGVQPRQLSWQQVRQLQSEGVSFANHSSVHNHLLTGSDQPKWLENTLADISKAEKRLKKETGQSLKYVAYPYGEFNYQLKTALREKGYIGFGQHSGAVSTTSDFGALPRFPAAGIYANLNTLKVKLNSLAMPVIEISNEQPQLSFDDRQPEQILTLDLSDMLKQQVSCFYKGDSMTLAWQENRADITVPEVLPVGRSRVNCTAPSISKKGRFYWFSQPWFVPTESGNWPD